jgi:hypothetical protein
MHISEPSTPCELPVLSVPPSQLGGFFGVFFVVFIFVFDHIWRAVNACLTIQSCPERAPSGDDYDYCNRC